MRKLFDRLREYLARPVPQPPPPLPSYQVTDGDRTVLGVLAPVAGRWRARMAADGRWLGDFDDVELAFVAVVREVGAAR